MLKKNLTDRIQCLLVGTCPHLVFGLCAAAYRIELQNPMLGTFWSDTLVTAALLITSTGCHGHSARVAASDARQSSSPSGLSSLSLSPLTATPGVGVFLAEHSLSIALPEPKLWQVNKVGTYARASHTETASVLWLKRWRQGERVSVASCEHQSRLWQPGLAPPVTPPTRRLTLTAPAHYHTAVTVHEWRDGDTWHGRLTANGAAIRDCISYVYLTRAPDSPLGKAIVTQRVDVMLDALRSARIQDTPIARE